MVAGLVALVGMVVGGLAVWRTMSGVDRAFDRFIVPGEVELQLEQAGTHTIYYEHRSVVDGRVFATGGEDVSNLLVAVESVTTGRELTLRPSPGDIEYEVGGRAGVAVLVFEVAEPGTYRVSGWYPEGAEGPEVVLAVGRGVVRQIALGLAVGIGVPILSWGLAIVIAAVTFVRRRRAVAVSASGAVTTSGDRSPSHR